MSVSQDQLQSLMKYSELRERRTRRFALLLAIIPVLFALGFLIISVWNTYRVQQELVVKEEQLNTAEVVLQQTINKYQTVDSQLASAAQSVAAAENTAAIARQEAAAAQAEVERAKGEVQQLSAQLEQSGDKLSAYEQEITTLRSTLEDQRQDYSALQTQVQLASQFQPVRDYNQWQIWLKDTLPYFYRLYANDPEAAAMIARLLNVLDELFARSPAYNVSGSSLEEGFSSPSFAMYVLKEIGRVPDSRTPLVDQAQLRDYLLANGMQVRPDNRPQPGDLVLYKDGFSMFYFPDPQQRPFVIGMTAGGVKVLEPGFAEMVEVIGVVR